MLSLHTVPPSSLFQLRLIGVGGCRDWLTLVILYSQSLIRKLLFHMQVSEASLRCNRCQNISRVLICYEFNITGSVRARISAMIVNNWPLT